MKKNKELNMDVKDYQEYCKQNWKPGCTENDLYFVMGLAGETGEVCEEFKKAIRDSRPVNKENVVKELGDVLWYLTNMCTVLGVTLEDVMMANVRKLDDRYHPEVQLTPEATGYRYNGPHIEMYNTRTNKHIKFCCKCDVPEEQLKKLEEVPWK